MSADESFHDDAQYVATAMERYGGSFVKCLGMALKNADRENALKIRDTWPKYWRQYKNMRR